MKILAAFLRVEHAFEIIMCSKNLPFKSEQLHFLLKMYLIGSIEQG